MKTVFEFSGEQKHRKRILSSVVVVCCICWKGLCLFQTKMPFFQLLNCIGGFVHFIDFQRSIAPSGLQTAASIEPLSFSSAAGWKASYSVGKRHFSAFHLPLEKPVSNHVGFHSGDWSDFCEVQLFYIHE